MINEKRNAVRKSLERIHAIRGQGIGAAFAVHRGLGPGLLESADQTCRAYTPTKRGIAMERQKAMPVAYEEGSLDCGYRVDLLVERAVLGEDKAVDRFEPIPEAKRLASLKLSGRRVGLLIHFKVPVLKAGLRRRIHG